MKVDELRLIFDRCPPKRNADGDLVALETGDGEYTELLRRHLQCPQHVDSDARRDADGRVQGICPHCKCECYFC